MGQLQNFWNEAEKKGTTLIGEYIPNMGIIYWFACLTCIFFDRRRAQRRPCLLLSVSRAVPANLSGGSRTKGKTSLYGLYNSWNSWKKGNNCALFLYCLQLMHDYKQSTQYYHDNQVFYKVIASLLSWFVMEIKVYICTWVTIFKWRFEGHIHIVLTCRVSSDTPDDYNV